MEKLKAYGCIVLALISAFTLGMYTFSVMNNLKTVEIHQWVLTSGFGLMFLLYGLDKLEKIIKNK